MPLNDALSADPSAAVPYIQNTHHYIIGPFVELRLPSRFSVEVDALYRSYDYRLLQVVPRSVSPGAWEFPVLARKALFGGPVQPYVEGGVALSHLSVSDVIELNHRNNFGIVLGAGCFSALGFVPHRPRNSATTVGRSRNFDSPLGSLQSNRNQAAVLVGISF